MAGLIAGAMAPQQAPTAAMPTQAAPSGGSKLKNATLQQVESEVEAKVSPQAKKMYLSIVTATMKLAFDEKTHPLLIKGLQSSPDVIKNISLICAGMIGTVYQESKQDPDAFIAAAIPAAMSLMCQILQFAEDSQMIQVTPEVVAKCTSATTSAVLTKFGITQDKIKAAVASGKQPQGQPQASPQPAPMGA